jgi:NAD(P)H dehydrogenase (quinone)
VTSSAPRCLVTGASGQLGRRVVDHLVEADVRVVAATRSPHALRRVVPAAVDVRHADLDEPETLQEAFAEVDRILLISTSSDPTGQSRVRRHRAAIAAAERSGADRIVYTSITGAHRTSAPSMYDDHRRTEEALAASRLRWTVLRHNLYTDQLLDAIPQALAFGRMTAVAPYAPIAYVTREDCARADAAALLSTDDFTRHLTITGPVAVDRASLATTVGAWYAHHVDPFSVEPDLLRAALVRAGVWPHVADSMIEIETTIAAGLHGVVSTDLEALTGTAGRSVLDELQARAAQLISAADRFTPNPVLRTG